MGSDRVSNGVLGGRFPEKRVSLPPPSPPTLPTHQSDVGPTDTELSPGVSPISRENLLLRDAVRTASMSFTACLRDRPSIKMSMSMTSGRTPPALSAESRATSGVSWMSYAGTMRTARGWVGAEGVSLGDNTT